jgi:hypothetical protein
LSFTPSFLEPAFHDLRLVVFRARHFDEARILECFAKVATAREAAEATAASAGPGGAAGAGSGGAYWSNVGGGALGNFVLDATGLYRLDGKRWERIAQGFETLGLARDAGSTTWGKVIKFANQDKLVCQEIVTSTMLHNDLKGVIGQLADLGMFITGKPDGRLAFAEFLLLEEETDKRATVTSSTGWIEIGGQRVFVLPNEVIGAAINEDVVLAKGVGVPYAQRGMLDQWRDAIATPAGDHLIPRFTIATSLSGPLLDLGGFESGIVHFHGPSSKGKTTMLRVAGSAWGSGADNGFVRRWRTTDNALESTLASANDTLLPLDELVQVQDAFGSQACQLAYLQSRFDIAGTSPPPDPETAVLPTEGRTPPDLASVEARSPGASGRLRERAEPSAYARLENMPHGRSEKKNAYRHLTREEAALGARLQPCDLISPADGEGCTGAELIPQADRSRCQLAF